jgi:glycosyltransferase involved in cell wall biosynthesis
MSGLSVVLATYNEEENLGPCLDSVKDISDEIVVVDGLSQDRTVEIAKRYHAKVKVTTNKPIFHINKQMAIDMATKDWVFQLDADERVTAELAKEIKEEIGNWKLPASQRGEEIGNSRVNGYWIPRKNWFLGRFLTKGGQYPDYTLRLYRRGKGRLPQKSVHEQAVVEGKVGYLKNPLIHIADPTFARYLKRFDRYANLISNELKEKKIGYNPIMAIKYLLVLPIRWFVLTYIRHKGFMDSWQGFVFSLFSSLRFPVGYFKFIIHNS